MKDMNPAELGELEYQIWQSEYTACQRTPWGIIACGVASVVAVVVAYFLVYAANGG